MIASSPDGLKIGEMGILLLRLINDIVLLYFGSQSLHCTQEIEGFTLHFRLKSLWVSGL
jgi:hypothetical protein